MRCSFCPDCVSEEYDKGECIMLGSHACCSLCSKNVCITCCKDDAKDSYISGADEKSVCKKCASIVHEPGFKNDSRKECSLVFDDAVYCRYCHGGFVTPDKRPTCGECFKVEGTMQIGDDWYCFCCAQEVQKKAELKFCAYCGGFTDLV